MSATSVSPKALHNVFNLVSGIERTSGKTKFRCIYAKNKNLTVDVINPRLFIPKDTVSSTTTLYVGYDINAGIGDGTGSGVAQSIPNETTAPTGVLFTNATDPSKGIPLGMNIPPGKTVAIWLKLVIFLNTAVAKVDGAEIKLRTGNLKPATGGTPTTNVILAITGETDSLVPFSSTIQRMKLRTGINSYVYTGDCTTSTDATTWINMLGLTKDKTAIAFGPQDAKSATLKNQLITATSTNQNSKSLGYSFQRINNTYMIFLDVTQTFTNPSPQFDFVVAQLNIAKTTAGVDFIIVVSNKAFYMTLASNDAALTIDDTLRTTYHKLFTDSGVHLVISGQTRNYQRQHVLGFNAASHDAPTTFLTADAPNYEIPIGQKNFGPASGCLFIDIGTGGMKPSHTPVAPKKSYTSFATGLQNTTSIGYLMIKSVQKTATRGPTLLGIFYEYFTPVASPITGVTATPIEIQRDNFAITLKGPETAPTPGPVNPPPPPPSTPPGAGATDKFGVESSYATGQIKYDWVQNFRSDGKRFDFEDLYPDFESCELIGYYRFTSNRPDDEVSGKMGGGGHSTGSSPKCYDMGIEILTGDSRYRLEENHPTTTGGESGPTGTPLNDKFIGYKFIKWNRTDHVLLEIWQDTGNNEGTTPANDWHRVATWDVDDPLWLIPPSDHQETIRIDGPDGVAHLEWKWLSLREITPTDTP